MLRPIDSPPVSQEAALLALGLVLPTLLTYVYFVLLAAAPAVWQQGAYMIGKTVQFALPVLGAACIARQRLVFEPPAMRDLLAGGLLGGSIVAVMVLAYAAWLVPAGVFEEALPQIRGKVAGMNLATRGRFLALGTFYAVCHSFLEEYYWRWFIFDRLRARAGRVPAMLISAAGFTAHHVIVVSLYFGWFTWASLLFCLGVGAGGLLWARLYGARRSLYGPWASHLLVDAAIFGLGFHLLRNDL